MTKVDHIKKFVFLLFLAIVSCNVRKNEDFAIIATEARLIREKLISSETPINNNVVEDIIKSSSVDGAIRWEISNNSRFLVKSKKMHSSRATSNEMYFWYIDINYSIEFRKN